MAEGFDQWESDPLFSAAEVVQESADRMESAFRMLTHEQSLAQDDPSNSKLLSLMKYHRRDLLTALETTKWQLEDFEREVNSAASSDKFNSRANAILRHRHFVRAIREHIAQVEKSVQPPSTLHPSTDTLDRNSQWMNSNEQDTNDLALFLSGGDSRDNLQFDSGSNILRRFLDSTKDGDEIIELETEAVEPLPTNKLNHLDYGYNSYKDHMPCNEGSHYSKRSDKAPASFKIPEGPRVHEESNIASRCYDLELGDSIANCYSYRNSLSESVRGLLRNIWLANKSKGSFIKRRKDGEVDDNLMEGVDQRKPSSAINVAVSEQSKYYWMRWPSVFRICERLNLDRWTTSTQFTTHMQVIQRRIQRSQYLILSKRFPMRLASAVLIMLIVLGILACYIT